MSGIYATLAIVMALMATLSAIMKLRHDPTVTRSIHDVVGVPLKFFPFLAACEFAGALGLLLGIAWPALGLAASAGLSLYFIGAVVGHLGVGDFKGLGPATFMLGLSGACLIVRVRSM